MFKNRKMTVTLDKKDKNEELMEFDPEAFEKRVAIVLHHLESVGKKLFIGICVFVVLDTARQVAVEQSKPD